MDRGSRILVFLALFGALYFLFNGKSGEAPASKIQPTKLVLPEGERPVAQYCDLWTDEYRMRVSSRGGVLVSDEPLTAKYRKHGKDLELVTTPDHPTLSPLYSSFRSLADTQGARDWLVTTDIQDFTIDESSARICRLSYQDDRVRIEKVIRTGDTPYAIELSTSITNLGDTTRPYAMSVGMGAYHLNAHVESKMFRMNPLMTHVECIDKAGEATRELVEEFAPDDFEDTERFRATEVNPGDWSQPPGKAALAAVSNAYFTAVVGHDDGPDTPFCMMQIDERFRRGQFKNKDDDPKAGAIYRSRLAYAARDLPPKTTETYKFKAFIGPKERKALAAAGERFEAVIDLGFFSAIAKVLVGYLMWLYGVVPSWGVAIVLLTITAKLLLFPLTWPSVKNMVHMRELKPEMDKLNEQYKDDAQAKGLAQMQLWKKHGVNPMKGCLPQLISMPVWFALYTTLQTAVELYNIPFLWFPDLSEADPYYILPFVIGAVFFVQQKMMPAQADPAQQKMMMYMMPGMFTLFMLVLPAGLGVYMFTNSLLGIGQQQLVEMHAKKTLEARRALAQVTDTPGAPKKKSKSKSKNKRA